MYMVWTADDILQLTMLVCHFGIIIFGANESILDQNTTVWNKQTSAAKRTSIM